MQITSNYYLFRHKCKDVFIIIISVLNVYDWWSVALLQPFLHPQIYFTSLPPHLKTCLINYVTNIIITTTTTTNIITAPVLNDFFLTFYNDSCQNTFSTCGGRHNSRFFFLNVIFLIFIHILLLKQLIDSDSGTSI